MIMFLLSPGILASGVFDISTNFVLIAAGALVVFTVLNVCIVLLACFIMRKV